MRDEGMMRSYRRLALVVWLAAGLLVSHAASVSAKMLAYFFDNDGQGIVVRTFDTDTDTIVAQRRLPQLQLDERDEWRIVASPADGLLFVMYNRGRGDFRVAVFEFTTLAFKRELDAVSPNRPWMLVPPKAPYFLLRWFDPTANNGQGAERMTRYEKATLNKIEHVPDVPFRLFGAEKVFSVDGQRIYSYTASDASIVRIFATQTLQLVSTVDIPAVLSPNRWGEGIEDVRGDRVLLAENHKAHLTDPDRLSVFTVALLDGTRSPKIDTGLEGNSRLTPSGDKILLEETTTVWEPDGRTVMNVVRVGRLHIYNVATGTKLGQVSYPVSGRGGGLFLGTRPAGDKAYFTYRDPATNAGKVAVVSISSLALLKEMVVEPIRQLVFFEQ